MDYRRGPCLWERVETRTRIEPSIIDAPRCPTSLAKDHGTDRGRQQQQLHPQHQQQQSIPSPPQAPCDKCRPYFLTDIVWHNGLIVSWIRSQQKEDRMVARIFYNQPTCRFLSLNRHKKRRALWTIVEAPVCGKEWRHGHE